MINISDDEEGSPVPSAGEEPVSAVKSRTRTAAQLAGINVKNHRRARFAQKYAGLTPEQTLGESKRERDHASGLTSISCSSALVSKGWRSAIYDHFHAPKIVHGVNGSVIHRFTCKK